MSSILLFSSSISLFACSANSASGEEAMAGGAGNASGGSAFDEGSGGAIASGGDHSGSGGSASQIEECEGPSIDRYQQWLASGEGPTLPASGSLLVQEGETYVARAEFTSASEWHVLAIWLGNEFGASVDLSHSKSFSLTYSATHDFYIQLRPAAEWSGGAKWHMLIPSTAGLVTTTSFPFEASAWTERLGAVPHTFEAALADASGLVPVGNSKNEIAFFGLQVDGYEPPCL